MRRRTQASLNQCAQRFGYGEIMTPTFEHTDLFLRKSGEEVAGQIYTFEDKGGRSLTLRPELTAATIRLVSDGMRDVPQPIRLFYFENCFRYERPQKGRYREFWQWGAELIGPDTAEADAEIIHLAYSVLKEAGLDKFNMRIGYVGILKDLIPSLLEDSNINIDTTISQYYSDNLNNGRTGGIMSLIDKGEIDTLEEIIDNISLNINQNVKDILFTLLRSKHTTDSIVNLKMWLSEYSNQFPKLTHYIERLENIIHYLSDAIGEKNFVIDVNIARGLDYYTGVVFECDVEALGAEKQVLGGGRYELSHLFDMRDTPMTGFALGFDRLLLALELEGKSGEPARPDVYVVPFTKEDVRSAQELVARLRNAGLGAEGDLAGRQMKKALAHASSRDPRFIVFCGGEEGGRGNVVLKDAATREQKEVPLAELEGILRQRLPSKL